MARRVNTKFVIILSSILLLVAAVSFLILASRWLNGRDPKWLKEQAKAAEAAKNMAAALQFYGRAAQASARTHEADTADLYYHAGEISMALSGEETDSIKAQRYFEQAISNWRAALTENSKYLPAQQRFLEQSHLYADLSRDSANWSSLKDAADKVIAVDPNSADAYLYRAQAQFQLLQNLTGTGSVTSGLKDVEADIAKSIQLNPNKAETVVLKSVVLEFEAQDAQGRNLPKDAEKDRAASLAALKDFLSKHPHDPQATLRLAQIVGVNGDIPQMMKIIREGYAANTGEPLLGEALASVDRYTNREEAEKVLKELQAAHPESTDSYRRLAAFYAEGGRYEEALNANRDVLTHLEAGGGVVGIKRAYNQMEALYNLCWLSMDKAEREGVSTAEGKADMDKAAAFTDTYRGSSPPRASVSLLDGRIHYLRGQIPAAISDLKNADVAYSLGSSKSPQWLQTKTLLGECFEKQSDWGTALGYYDQILKAIPTQLPVILHRAMVLNRVGRYSEAVAVVEHLNVDKMPDGLKIFALQVKSMGLDGMGKTTESQEVFAHIDSPAAKLNIARSMLMDNDLTGALEQLNELLKKPDDRTEETALNLAILVNIQLGHREEAQKLVDEATGKYPKNTQLQVIQAALKSQTGDSKDSQIETLKTIPDDYMRYITLAQFYRQLADHETDGVAQRKDHENELASLEQAFSHVDNSEGNRTNYALVVERIFNLSLEMAATSTSTDEKTKYFDTAQKYETVADRDNLDGVNGKLYQGRLEFLRDDQAKGIKTLEQAVAQRPDFSAGHAVLGRAYMEAHKEDEAMEQFHLAIAQNPANLPAIKMAMTILYKKTDALHVAEAQEMLKNAYRIAPHDKTLAAFNDVLGDPSDAIRLRKKTYDDTPADKRDTPDALDNQKRLAMLYVRRADVTKNADDKKQSLLQAIELLRPLYDKQPDDLEAADVLARLYKQTDQSNDALKMYEHFLLSKDASVVFDAMLLEGDMLHSMERDDQAVSVYVEAIKKQSVGNDQAERRLADLYFETNDMANAEAYYQKIYDHEQVKDMRVLRRLAEALIRQDKYAPADELFATLFKNSDPAHPDPEGLVLQGFSLFKQNKQDQAIANFNKILSDPQLASSNSHYRADALYYRAFARFAMQQDLDLATKDLEIVRTESPDNMNARLLLARVYRAAHRLAESVNEYAQLLQLKPDFGIARLEYAQFLFQLAQIQKQLPPDSQEDVAYVIRNINPAETLTAVLVDAEKRYPQQMEWLIVHGDLMELLGRADVALQFYGTAYDKSGGNATAGASYVNLLVQLKKYDDAVSVATQVISQNPKDASVLLRRAAAYAGKGMMKEATADVEQAIALSGTDVTAGMATEQDAGAALPLSTVVDLLQKRLDANKDEVGTRVALAQALIGNNQPADAVKVIAPVRADANAKPQVKAVALRMEALAKYEAKDFAGAQVDYDELLKGNPNDIESLNNMAFMLADDMKRPKDGLAYADRAMKLMGSTSSSLNLSTSGNVLDTHGWVLYLGGDTVGSITDLSRAVSLSPQPAAYLHLATAYRKAGRSDDAAKAVVAGLQVAGKNDASRPGLEALGKQLNVQ